MFFQKLISRIIPRVKAADEEPEVEDPQQVLREKCRESDHTKHFLEKLEECTARVTSKAQTTETCAEELLDFLHEVDHCVTKDLFSKLK